MQFMPIRKSRHMRHGADRRNEMVKLTKEQRKALHRVYLRGTDYPTYRQFRKTVQPAYDCIMVHWCNMWLGIEKDGYTHS